MALPPPLQQIVDFLRLGYPDGVPQQDYQPLLALLGRELSAASPAELEAGTDEADEAADEVDVERVRRRLEAAGWAPHEHRA